VIGIRPQHSFARKKRNKGEGKERTMSKRQMTRPTGTRLAEQSTVLGLAMQREAPLSDAPLYVPQANPAQLLAGLLLEGPKEPKEPRNPKKV
jgi:hypothetical protein